MQRTKKPEYIVILVIIVTLCLFFGDDKSHRDSKQEEEKRQEICDRLLEYSLLTIPHNDTLKEIKQMNQDMIQIILYTRERTTILLWAILFSVIGGMMGSILVTMFHHALLRKY